MAVKFMTIKGSGNIGSNPFYIGVVQHERTMNKKETYDYLAEKIGFRAVPISAVFLAMREYIIENQKRGNITFIDGVASIRNYVKGAFESLNGPWVKGRNHLLVQAVEVDPFKTVLAGIVPANNTQGAKPVINTVLDDVTREYDVITGTHVFSIAGSDLAPDPEADDEYVALVDKDGVETRATISASDLQNVKAALAQALPAGEYTLKVYTRSGMGGEFGVKTATRKVTVG